MKYTHIIFDIDNTLTDTTAAVLHGLQKAIREVTGKHWELGRLTPVLGIPGSCAFKVLGITSQTYISQIYPLWEHYMASYQHTAYVYEGILPLMEYLRRKGFALGIITSKTRKQYKDSFVPFGLSGFFQSVVTADDTLRHKPDPAPMKEYMKLNHIEPAHSIYVGDSIYDMECARATNVDSGLALWGNHNPQGISSTYRFSSPVMLTEWFRQGCPAQS